MKKDHKRAAEAVASGVNHHTAGQLRKAEYFYQLALKSDPDYPDALNLMGVLAVEANQYPIALDYLKRAVRQHPQQPMFLNNLGNTLHLMGDSQAALPLFQKALRLSPRYAEAACNIGRALRALGRHVEARHFLEKALSFQPGFIRAEAALGELYVETGDMEQATLTFRHILSRDPGNVQSLSGIAFAHHAKADDPELQMIETRLQEPLLPGEQKAMLRSAAGKICNDLGRYDEAIRHFIQRKFDANLRFPIEIHRQTYAALRSLYSPELIAEKAASGDPASLPVFIIGMPRSGTTLVEQIISSHSQVFGAGELPNIRRLAQEFGFGRLSDDYAGNVRNLSRASIQNHARAYLDAVQKRASKVKLISDKNPHNYEQLGLIAMLLPNARVIHCRRDPLDTCVSCFMQNFDPSHGYNADLETLGRYYREYEKLMDHWREVVPLRLFEISYEELVKRQEAVTRQLISFLGLPWEDNCLAFHENARPVTTPSRWQVRQPLYGSSLNRWKLYDSHLGPLRKGLG
jgi:tetratricopeptide (TPR) repeat protein